MTEAVKQDLDMDITHMKVLKDWLGDSLTQKAFKKSIDIAIKSMEKQIPKKLKVCKTPNTSFGKTRTYYLCPTCGAKMCCDWKFCFECGQALDWEEGGTSD